MHKYIKNWPAYKRVYICNEEQAAATVCVCVWEGCVCVCLVCVRVCLRASEGECLHCCSKDFANTCLPSFTSVSCWLPSLSLSLSLRTI